MVEMGYSQEPMPNHLKASRKLNNLPLGDSPQRRAKAKENHRPNNRPHRYSHPQQSNPSRRLFNQPRED